MKNWHEMSQKSGFYGAIIYFVFIITFILDFFYNFLYYLFKYFVRFASYSALVLTEVC